MSTFGPGLSNQLDYGPGGPVQVLTDTVLSLGTDLHTDGLTLTNTFLDTKGYRIFSRGPVILNGSSLYTDGESGFAAEINGLGGRTGAGVGTMAGGFRGGDGANVTSAAMPPGYPRAEIDRSTIPLPGEAGFQTVDFTYPYGYSAAIGSGGTGGLGSSQIPGAGGVVTWNEVALGKFLTPQFAQLGFVMCCSGTISPIGGAGGGGGGSNHAAKAGGGGQGGGTMFISAPIIILAGGNISANGGNGGDGIVGISGGGGGGQGGYIVFHTSEVRLDATSHIKVLGGTGGFGDPDTGIGNANPGQNGKIYLMSEVYGIFTITTGHIDGALRSRLP